MHSISSSPIYHITYLLKREESSRIFFLSIWSAINRHHFLSKGITRHEVTQIRVLYQIFYMLYISRTISFLCTVHFQQLSFWSWQSNLYDCTQLNLLLENSHFESESFCKQIIVFFRCYYNISDNISIKN